MAENPHPVVHDGQAMIAGMTPALDPEPYVMCSLPAQRDEVVRLSLAVFREREGISHILPLRAAEDLRLNWSGPVLARITLEVYSSLEGVGLTAAVATALAAEGIACNMVAAFHHDHVFVPRDRAEAALKVLLDLQAWASAPAGGT